MSVPEEILKKIATKGDLGAFLVGFGAGFAADVFSWMGGIPTVDPLTAGLGAGAAALGVKQSIQGAITKRLHASRTRARARKIAEYIREIDAPALKQHLPTLGRIEALASTLEPEAVDAALAKIESALLVSAESTSGSQRDG